MISRMVAGLVTGPDLAEVQLAGDLQLSSAPEVQRVLDKLLASHHRLLVDVRRLRLGWSPAVQIFATVLASTDGWPAVRMVVFGADADMTQALRKLRVTKAVPLAIDRASALELLAERPKIVARRLRLAPLAEAPSAARRFVGHACRDWSLPETAATATMVVNELVTNVVLHARTDCEVELRLGSDGLWIEVNDYRPGTPPPVHGHGSSATGAGACTWSRRSPPASAAPPAPTGRPSGRSSPPSRTRNRSPLVWPIRCRVCGSSVVKHPATNSELSTEIEVLACSCTCNE